MDRLHAAQIAALPERPLPPRDAYGAERELLERLGEMGSLLLRLARPAPPPAPPGSWPSGAAEAPAAAVRRRLVYLAVACANTLAELVGLAFEVEEPAVAPAARGSAHGEPRRLRVAPPARAGHGARTASPRPRISLRAVTDTNALLVDQLRRLLASVERQERWRSARPGELWRGVLQQVARLFPLVAAMEAGPLSAAEAQELAWLIADAANHLAFLRFYPRLPTV